MRDTQLLIGLVVLLLGYSVQFPAHAAAPAGPLIKHLSSVLRWTTRASNKAPQTDGNHLQFENGYLVETVVEGNEIGVVPYRIRVSDDGELYAVDAINSNIVKITPPLSQYSRARLVAGSFKGYTGHVDGKPSEARFNHPRGVTMDDRGNVYVADTSNFAIRKIGDSGVTTIAGGKSNFAGYRDGPSEDAKFSNDFDIVYVRPTCSLLVIDRGNAALRQISLNEDDCDHQYSSISLNDILLVIGAVVVGYATSMLHQGFGYSYFSRTHQPSEGEVKEHPNKDPYHPPVTEISKEEPGWPSFGQLITDLSKLGFELLGSSFLKFVPARLRPGGSKNDLRPSSGSKNDLRPLKGRPIMPEDEAKPPLVKRHTASPLLSEPQHVHPPNLPIEKASEPKPPKIKSSVLKDPSLSSKHRSSKRHQYAEYYASGEIPVHSRSKTLKERSRHRLRDKSGEVGLGAGGSEPKPPEVKPINYDNPKFDHYNMRNRYGF